MIKFRKVNAIFAVLLGLTLIYMELEYRKTQAVQGDVKS